MVHVIRSFNRPPETVVKEIAKFSPATLHEAQGRRGALDSRIKPIGSGMRACGPAVTAQCPPGDNLMLQAAISVARPGDVLVVSAGNHTEQGGFGEVLTTACLARGIAGLVTDAGVRDGLAIKKLGFPVFCLGSCMKGTVKETLGTVNQPVVIVRQEEAAEVAARAREREEKEARFMQALRNGANVLEVLGMDKVLGAKGCTYADQA